MNSDYEIFANNLKFYMNKYGYNQSTLAEKLGVEFTDGTYDLRGGKYNSVLNQVMITGKYTQTDEKGNTIHYGLFKLDDIVEILLNWEDE